jgi:hypothetical protein
MLWGHVSLIDYIKKRKEILQLNLKEDFDY